MLPLQPFTDNVVGTTGVGLEAEDYIARSGARLIKGTEHISDLLEHTRGTEESL